MSSSDGHVISGVDYAVIDGYFMVGFDHVIMDGYFMMNRIIINGCFMADSTMSQ